MPKLSKTRPPKQFFDPQQAEMLKYVSEDAPSKLRLFEAVFTRRASPRQRIKAMCCQCCWHDHAAIRGCKDTACPLWHERPFQKED